MSNKIRADYLTKLESLTEKIVVIKKETSFKLNRVEDEIYYVLNEFKEFEKSQDIENKYDLTRSKDVEKFLELSRESLRRFREDGRFKENVHFKYDENERVKYIPEGIISFEKTFVKNERKIRTDKEKQNKEKIRKSNLSQLNIKFAGRAA